MVKLGSITGRVRDEARKALRFGLLSPMVPPEAKMYDGTPTFEDFEQNAKKAMTLFVEIAGLKPEENVLDVGSGIGRKCLYLTKYLKGRGTYDGFDIVKEGVDWCTKKISSKYPSFRYQHVDVFNQHYNPGGSIQASDFRFPFEDASFDLVTMFSVFTHMLTNDVRHYLAETSRVLRPGGRSLITWFILNPESKDLVSRGKAPWPLTHQFDEHCRVAYADQPEAVVGHEEDQVRNWYREAGLVIREPVMYGSWCGRKGDWMQDMILADKR